MHRPNIVATSKEDESSEALLLHSKADPDSEESGDQSWKLYSCCCLCWCSLFFAPLLWALVLSYQWGASCQAQKGVGQAVWNNLIPTETMSQKKSGFSTVLWEQVDVFNPQLSNSTPIGWWTDEIGMFGNYNFFEAATGQVLLNGKAPWGVYLGKRYDLYACNGFGKDYTIQEDWWARNWWFMFWVTPQRKFQITDTSTGSMIAISQNSRERQWSANARYSAEFIEPSTNQVIAYIFQENLGQWTLSDPRWHSKNLRPDVLPNEILSFLSAVYDIDLAPKSGGGGRKR